MTVSNPSVIPTTREDELAASQGRATPADIADLGYRIADAAHRLLGIHPVAWSLRSRLRSITVQLAEAHMKHEQTSRLLSGLKPSVTMEYGLPGWEVLKLGD